MTEKLENNKKGLEHESLLYAGAVCPKCKRGINNEEPLKGYDEIRKKQQKRYGMARLCNKCIITYVK